MRAAVVYLIGKISHKIFKRTGRSSAPLRMAIEDELIIPAKLIKKLLVLFLSFRLLTYYLILLVGISVFLFLPQTNGMKLFASYTVINTKFKPRDYNY